MKLILDLDEKVVKNMQGYASLHGITINELVETLFNKYVQEPANAIDRIVEHEGNLNKLQRFAKTLTNYVNETTLDIESLIGTDEEQDDDKAMVEVFKKLNRDHLGNLSLLVDLYKVYTEEINE